MKNLILISALIALTACNTTPVVEETARVQSVDDARDTLDAHIEKANMNRNFCDSRGFSYYAENRYSYYAENRYSYTFRCKSVVDENGNYKEGGYFHLVK